MNGNIKLYQLDAVSEFFVLDFFKEGKNGITKLFFNDSFKKLLETADSTVSAPQGQIALAILERPEKDIVILNSFSSFLTFFSLSNFLAYARDLLIRQPDEKSNGLLGQGNVFYVANSGKTFIVFLRLHTQNRIFEEWQFFCRPFENDSSWPSGTQVILKDAISKPS